MKAEMKKILFVINTMGYGGAERALLNLISALEKEQYEISVFVLTGQGELIHQIPDSVTLLNKNYKDVSVLTSKGRMELMKTILRAGILKGAFFRRFSYLIKNSVNMKQQGRFLPDKLLWRILADGAPTMPKEYDLAVAYLEGGATYYVADRVKAKKKAAFIHIDYKKAGYGEKLDLGCYEKIDRIFTVSDEVKEHFLEVYPKYQNKVSVFHNLLDMDNVRTMAEKPGGFQDDFKGIRLLTVGRLVAQKRYDMVIQTMILLKQKSKKPIRWYIMGEGELRTKLEQQISENHLTEDVILLGVKENPFPYYKQCDIYVHATRFEGKSIAIQEAQTLGCAIVASDCSGNREQINNEEDGLLCQFDAVSIKDAILELINDKEKRVRLGEAAANRKLIYEEDMGLLFELMSEE